jgi:hypothetical protein
MKTFRLSHEHSGNNNLDQGTHRDCKSCVLVEDSKVDGGRSGGV